MQALVFLGVFAAAFGLFYQAVRDRIRFLRAAAPDPTRQGHPKERWRSFVVYVLGQRKVLAEPSGMLHVLIFWGFLVLVWGDLDFIGYHLSGWHLPWALSPVYAFVQELFSALVLVAVLAGLWRRYGLRPMRLEASAEAGLILALIALIVLTYYTANAADAVRAGWLPGWEAPVASGLARLLQGWPGRALLALSLTAFWLHVLCICAFLVLIPRSKHAHMLAAMCNWYFRRLDPPGRLRKLDLDDEQAESFGAGHIEQFTWKQLLDGFACTECGRCHIQCPATLTGKPLSPKYVMLKMKDHLVAQGPSLLAQAAGAETATEPLFARMFSEEEIWACTTCRACEEACPVANEHVQAIVDMRRYLVLTEGKAAPEVHKVFANLERQSNEWGLNRRDRAAWAQGLPVRTLAEAGRAEYLFYVGSAASFDARNQKIAQAFAKLLLAAGVDFAILGVEEESDGDSARRLGNEFLYQEFVQRNIALFARYGVRKILTTDPHAYNTFKNEYPDFGYQADEVWHSTEFAAKLLREGRLRPRQPLRRRVTYHDSCYLGRYNGMYDAPREILRSIPGVELVEMERSRNHSMCCGAGGGGMFKEEGGRQRINVLRASQALATGAEVVSTACPYCMTMLLDGTKAHGAEDRLQTYDVIELLAAAVADAG
ncbi:MAG: (Fe-S)-binding protein [Alicyclobacillus sp.]|nr:(Fe-S)-binding protein [Alicyclobacillus sp.]